jgi:hypothetical protein
MVGTSMPAGTVSSPLFAIAGKETPAAAGVEIEEAAAVAAKRRVAPKGAGNLEGRRLERRRCIFYDYLERRKNQLLDATKGKGTSTVERNTGQ